MSRKSFEASKSGDYSSYESKDETPIETVKELLALISFVESDFVVDVGSGKNKIWFKNIPTKRKEELELDEGKDFLEYNKQVDWIVGNPPFNKLIEFSFHSTKLCRKGFGFLISNARLNQITARRLNLLAEKGFYLNKIHITEIKKWFGRYYFIVFTKNKSDSISWKKPKECEQKQ